MDQYISEAIISMFVVFSTGLFTRWMLRIEKRLDLIDERQWDFMKQVVTKADLAVAMKEVNEDLMNISMSIQRLEQRQYDNQGNK